MLFTYMRHIFGGFILLVALIKQAQGFNIERLLSPAPGHRANHECVTAYNRVCPNVFEPISSYLVTLDQEVCTEFVSVFEHVEGTVRIGACETWTDLIGDADSLGQNSWICTFLSLETNASRIEWINSFSILRQAQKTIDFNKRNWFDALQTQTAEVIKLLVESLPLLCESKSIGTLNALMSIALEFEEFDWIGVFVNLPDDSTRIKWLAALSAFAKHFSAVDSVARWSWLAIVAELKYAEALNLSAAFEQLAHPIQAANVMSKIVNSWPDLDCKLKWVRIFLAMENSEKRDQWIQQLINLFAIPALDGIDPIYFIDVMNRLISSELSRFIVLFNEFTERETLALVWSHFAAIQLAEAQSASVLIPDEDFVDTKAKISTVADPTHLTRIMINVDDPIKLLLWLQCMDTLLYLLHQTRDQAKQHGQGYEFDSQKINRFADLVVKLLAHDDISDALGSWNIVARRSSDFLWVWALIREGSGPQLLMAIHKLVAPEINDCAGHPVQLASRMKAIKLKDVYEKMNP